MQVPPFSLSQQIDDLGKDLEEAVRSRAEVQALMEAEQQQMLRQ